LRLRARGLVLRGIALLFPPLAPLPVLLRRPRLLLGVGLRCALSLLIALGLGGSLRSLFCTLRSATLPLDILGGVVRQSHAQQL